MATHSSIVWKIALTWEPGMLQSMRSQRVGHNWVHAHTYIHVKGKTVPILEKRRGLLTAVPNLFSTRDWFHERPSFHRPGLEGWFQGDSSALHSLCTFSLLLLPQLHLRSSDPEAEDPCSKRTLDPCPPPTTLPESVTLSIQSVRGFGFN